MSDPAISLSQLESHLWEAANILRGPVDAADFKTYVFPLLFFKRISDVHDEEYQAALAEAGGDEEYARFPQNYRFQIPEDCHWRDVRAVTSNVGQALQKAMRGIEKANPETLYGIFGDAQWTNKDRLSDALLKDLIEHFSRISLGNQAAESDILGQSYEYLIKKFADATNKKAGEFYTPRPIVRLMVNILDPQEREPVARTIPEGDSRLKLGGVTVGGRTPLAVINGKTLAEDESVRIPSQPTPLTLKCLKIEKDSVLVAIEGEDAPRLLRLR